MANDTYRPEDFKDDDLIKKFRLQNEDAKSYFLNCIKPRLDRSYKLYMAYNGDRAKEIADWQANVFVPYTHAVVETLMPRILDARPDMLVQGRTEEDQFKAIKVQTLIDYDWEMSTMDSVSEDLSRSAMVYGTGYMQVYWKKDEREHKFLETKDLNKKKYEWKKRKQIFYDGPFAEWVDNYDLWYDWHNVPRECKQYWFRRWVLSGAEIKRRWPNADKKRLQLALNKPGGDLTDYASIRNEIKLTHEKTVKGADYTTSSMGVNRERYQTQDDPDLKMYEVFGWYRPYEDSFSVMVNEVPILKGGEIPFPYDFKETPFIATPFLRLPGEFEGMGLPMILENPQVMLNMIKNQRLDAASLNIHKMWIINPLANIDKSELVSRPYGIIYSTDPAGAREVQTSDIKASAYKEEELLKGDMRYASGVDDFSMGVGGGAGSATEVRHLRESTLERVRLFVNHLGDSYSKLMRFWIDMRRQFFTDTVVARIVGENGQESFPLIEKDDLKGEFDYKAKVLPSIAGKSDIEKKQAMDLFQLLIELPFVDQSKLTSKVLHPWDWSLDSIVKDEQEAPPLPEGMSPEGMPPGGEIPPEMAAMMGPGGVPPTGGSKVKLPSGINPDIARRALELLGGSSGFSQASSPINLLKSSGLPPTVKGAKDSGGKANPRGLNRGGKVNTNIPINKEYTPGENEVGRAQNIQR